MPRPGLIVQQRLSANFSGALKGWLQANGCG